MKSKLFYNVSRYLLAALFLFSGFAKGINPFGLSIEFGEYFSAMGLDFLRPLSTVSAFVLPAAEFLLGAMLFAGVFRRFCAFAASIFMGFFTLLTLWIAIFNPVTDCGCFGDLLVISNWTTFFKNILFSGFAAVLFIHRNVKMSEPKARLWITAALAAVSIALPLYCYSTLPLIDATPYKIGVNILSKMGGGQADAGHTTLLYRNLETGKTQKFEISDTTWYDESKWEFVDSQTTITEKGQTAAIGALFFFDEHNNDVAPDILAIKTRTTLFIVPAPEQLEPEERMAISRAARAALAAGDSVCLLHSSASIPTIAGAKPLSADQTLLRTMIQHHNGGVMVLQNGTITEKHPLKSIF